MKENCTLSKEHNANILSDVFKYNEASVDSIQSPPSLSSVGDVVTDTTMSHSTMRSCTLIDAEVILGRCINSNDDSGTHDSDQVSDHSRKAISQLLSFRRMLSARIVAPSLSGRVSWIILLPSMLNTNSE